MIAVDTSALMAMLLGESEAKTCAARLDAEAQVLISAGTVVEALIVAVRRRLGGDMADLIEAIGCEIVPVSAASARRAADANEQWGKGLHPAGLNFGDCFSYEIAKTHGCPLLFVGSDFAKTDVERAL